VTARGVAAALTIRPAVFGDAHHQPRHVGLPGRLQESGWSGAADRFCSRIDSGFAADCDFQRRVGHGAHRMCGVTTYSFSDVPVSNHPGGRRTVPDRESDCASAADQPAAVVQRGSRRNDAIWPPAGSWRLCRPAVRAHSGLRIPLHGEARYSRLVAGQPCRGGRRAGRGAVPGIRLLLHPAGKPVPRSGYPVSNAGPAAWGSPGSGGAGPGERALMLAALLLAVATAAVFYFLIGYPILLAISRRAAPQVRKDRAFQPTFSVLLAVHNGEEFLRRKLESLLALDYPAQLREILLISDGSTDATESVAASLDRKS